MSDDGMISAKGRILDLFSELDEREVESIERWISSRAYRKDLENKILLVNSDNILTKIGDAIKKLVPFEAEMPSENIIPPIVGEEADCTVDRTIHVDEFLYDEKQVSDLVKEGKVQRHYCGDCKSRNIKDLTLISHSMSKDALQYVFKVLLPSDLEDKQILDVGSRLGAVLYAAYYFTNAANIVGIEINEECCEVQKKIIREFSMDNNRIKIINSDITDKPDVVRNSDIIIINCLDFFVNIEKHKKIWQFFKQHIKKGSYVVCNRSMAETLSNLDMVDEIDGWLNICKASQQDNEIFFDVEECSELFLYTVS